MKFLFTNDFYFFAGNLANEHRVEKFMAIICRYAHVDDGEWSARNIIRGAWCNRGI